MLISLHKLEQLKEVYGESTAEEIMKTSARKISASLREVDIVSRFSADQFAVILPETGSSRALIAGNRIHEKIASLPISQEFNSSPLLPIIGIASFPTHARDENNLLTTALQYLEQAQQLGNNRVYTT